MAVTVMYGDNTAYNALIYGNQPHVGTMQYLQNQVSNISTTLTDAGKSFMSNTAELWDKFHGSAAIQSAAAALRRVGSIFQANIISPLFEIGSIQNAPLIMQRYIMAQPDIREAFHKQRIDGYSNDYVDMHPGVIGEDHYDYRRVMNGVIQIDNETGEEKTVHYLDDSIGDDKDLRLDEQVDIMSTWDIVSSLMKYGERDPTDTYNGKL
jgi:uncharacterized protein YbaA (DUF1428 family)